MQTFTVTGMSCQHCVGAVTEAISRADPGASTEVDLASGTVTVQNDTAPADVLLAAIAAEGYEAIPAAD